MLLALYALAPKPVHASSDDNIREHRSAFYSQLHKTKAAPTAPAVNNVSLLDRVFPEAQFQDGIIASPEHEDDLAFNYLWLQQHQADYQYHNGGSALGKILRMSVKAFYNAHYGSGSGNLDDSDSFSKRFTHVDYRLRLNGDNLRIAVEYSF